jgi:UDP-glucuronate 4-epimerase
MEAAAMRILVTGGAGFIGSHLAERLVSSGHCVSIVDDLNDFYSPEVKRANLNAVGAAGPVEFHWCDIRNVDAMDRIVGSFQPEAIFHLAARAGVRPSLEQPLLYEETNVKGTLILLEAARRNGVKKFVFASSSSVYGIANRVPFREDDPVHCPISPYAATKLAAEKFCFTYSHLYRLPVVCLRFFTVYGPRQRPDLAIHKFARLIEAGRPVPFFGDGSSGRDYTYIDDAVSGLLAALSYDTRFEIFNIGNSRPVKLTELVSTLEAALGKPAVLERRPDQPGDVPLTFADISKAGRLLGYQPRTSFEDGIRKFVEWMRAEN